MKKFCVDKNWVSVMFLVFWWSTHEHQLPLFKRSSNPSPRNSKKVGNQFKQNDQQEHNGDRLCELDTTYMNLVTDTSAPVYRQNKGTAVFIFHFFLCNILSVSFTLLYFVSCVLSFSTYLTFHQSVCILWADCHIFSIPFKPPQNNFLSTCVPNSPF